VILQNKQIIIMGGTSGIGWAAAKKFVEEGAHVICVGKPQETAIEFENITTLFADAREASTMTKAISLCIEKYGSFDGLLHVAGGSGRAFGDGPLDQMTIDGWNQTMELNATTVMLSNKVAIDYFVQHNKAGSIVNISSVLATHPAPSFFSTHAYAAAKAAIIGLSTTTAAYYAKNNIRINVISPGLVETPMSTRAAQNENIMSYIKTKQPLDGGRIGQVNDVTSLAALLLSDQTSFITGQNIAVDGGWSVSEGQIAQ
jgi:NAD(P)-dependent dehydrogenase (short-subunit alcohol dehydrogenase family)